MKHSILLSIVFLVLALQVNAQSNYAYLALDYNHPLTNRKWIDTPTLHGGVAGLRFFLKDEFSLGLDLNWTTYDQYEPTQTFYQDHGAITTDYYKYIYQYGVTATAQYYLWKTDIVYPYVGLGVGANLNKYSLYYNIYDEGNQSWGFLARPEAGIVVRFGKYRSLGAMAALHYDFSTSKSAEYNYSRFTNAGLKVGIVLMGRD